jgi:adenylyltransferase/sulfurtransferase
MNKAESACAAIRELNPGVKAIPLTERIVSGNAERLVAGSDIIIDCLDNFKARHALNRLSVKASIPLVHAGVTEFHGQLGFFHPPETPCLACFYPHSPGKQRFPIAGATAGVIGSLQAMEAIKALTGIGENLKNRILFFEGREMRFTTMALSKDPRCRVCGGKKR